MPMEAEDLLPLHQNLSTITVMEVAEMDIYHLIMEVSYPRLEILDRANSIINLEVINNQSFVIAIQTVALTALHKEVGLKTFSQSVRI